MTAGNGSIMRLAPIAMAYADQPEDAVRYAGLSSRTTHAAVESVEACEVLAAVLVAGFHGAEKTDMLAPETMKRWRTEKGSSFSPAIEEVVMGSYQHKEPPEIQGRRLCGTFSGRRAVGVCEIIQLFGWVSRGQ